MRGVPFSALPLLRVPAAGRGLLRAGSRQRGIVILYYNSFFRVCHSEFEKSDDSPPGKNNAARFRAAL